MKPVNESRIAQINGKMLIASSRTIVGRMKSQAIARSDMPRTRRATGGGGPHGCARSTSVWVAFVPFISSARASSSLPRRLSAAEGAIGLSPDEGRPAPDYDGSLPSCLKTFIQSLTSASSASCDVPLLATT